MTTFLKGPREDTYDYSGTNQIEAERRAALESSFDDFFDPAVDEHSAFYAAMEHDNHAAHLVAGTAFVELNGVVLRTECNKAHESMNEGDIENIRKLMWDVYVPHMKEVMQHKFKDSPAVDDDGNSFQAQMYVVHLSVRVAQALQLVFELNQKKTFSAVAKTAYEMALQDVLYHPHFAKRVKPFEHAGLINFLRRHPTYSTAFNTYVGYKLLRQQLVRGGGAGTNRKSNDAERMHDEAANRLWGVIEGHRGVYEDFTNAPKPFTMEWHKMYYKQVAHTLFTKLSTYDTSKETDAGPDMSDIERFDIRDKLSKPREQYYAPRDHTAAAVGSNITTSVSTTLDILGAIQESRNTVIEGTSKRRCATNADQQTAGHAGGSPGDLQTNQTPASTPASTTASTTASGPTTPPLTGEFPGAATSTPRQVFNAYTKFFK